MKQHQISTLQDLVRAEIKAIESGESTYADNDAEREHLREIDAELAVMYHDTSTGEAFNGEAF